eukprot:3053010-Rhodomonas_salina.1
MVVPGGSLNVTLPLPPPRYQAPILLPLSYAMSGTDLAYHAAMCCTDLGVGCYAVCGTDIAYAHPSSATTRREGGRGREREGEREGKRASLWE